ncbi:MAG TPA: SCO family protein [Steroidobacteraceae bacterium]
MSRRFASLVMLVLAATAASAGDRDADAGALRISQSAIGHVLGEYSLTDQDGRPLQVSSLRGRPLLVSLVYTECYYICSGLTLHLRDVVRMARQTLGERSFAVLTVGFDTAHDTPQRMRAYGRERGIASPDWHFASADAATLRRLTNDVGFTWSATPGGFDHVAQVTVIDATGRIVQQVYGQEFAPPALIEPLKQLVWGGEVRRGGVRGILDRVNLLCVVYDPSVGRYRFDYSMLVDAFPGVLVLMIAGAGLLLAARRPR